MSKLSHKRLKTARVGHTRLKHKQTGFANMAMTDRGQLAQHWQPTGKTETLNLIQVIKILDRS